MIEISQLDSRPTYGRLFLNPRARSHLIAAQGEGAAAVLAVLAGSERRLLQNYRALRGDR